MRAPGRVPLILQLPTVPTQTSLLLLYYVYFCACITLSTSSDYGVPIEIKLWDTGRTPLAHMVDVTNEFGLKVLAEHNFLNDNNIAFSPYGLIGIMVALYEGVDGESSYQIQRGMQLPWNRKVMRIGFRDIHRTLKTYFVPEEGFLAGLALNNENVTFNDQYKTILRFYGFDLDNDQLPTLSPETNTTVSEATTAAATPVPTEGPSPSGESPSTIVTTDTLSTAASKEETTPTPNPNAETINTVDIRQDAGTTGSAFLAPNAENTPTTPMTVIEQPTTESITEETTQIFITTTQVMTTDGQTTSNSATEPTTVTFTQTTSTGALTTEPANIQITETTNAFTNEPTLNNEVDTSTSDQTTTQTAVAFDETSITTQSTIQSSTVTGIVTEVTPTDSPMSSIIDGMTEQTSTTIMDASLATKSVASTPDVSTLETLERRKKSIVDFIFNNPPYVDDYLYYKSHDIGSEPSNNFLANGLKSVQVTYMRYDTVLEHAYLPHLEASAVRLPLDSERYYLLVVLPTHGGAPELGRLLSRMARESDLSDIYSVLRPRRVRGLVPSFTVKGHVTLTTDLQKLGIRDVFEPRQHDFTPMTRQSGVYVRSIEQAVSVAIHKYRPDDHKKHRYVTSRDPVVFSATYPFLYFVMDANIHVALMAGKMVDPLNSRIL